MVRLVDPAAITQTATNTSQQPLMTSMPNEYACTSNSLPENVRVDVSGVALAKAHSWLNVRVMAISASLHALLDQAIDYAGMFPPCALALEPALLNQASYARSPEAWMLNGFVLPVGQFNAAAKFVSQFDPSHPLRVAALGPKTTNAAGFLEALENIAAAVRSYSRSDINLMSVSHLEMFLPDDVDSVSLKAARSIVSALP